MLKIKRGLLLLTLAPLLSGCDYALLNPKGIIALQEKSLIITSALLMSIVVIPVIVLTFVFAWRYRASNTKATYAPDWAHSTILEIIWWSIPCVIIAILGVITWHTSHDLDPYKPLASKEKPLVIHVVAMEWKWLFIYPEEKIATVNFIQIPVNVPVKFIISAEGPMNSFQIPQLAGQIYAMAGMKTKLHMIANATGDYRGLSANFSGDGFADMKFTVRVSQKAEFDAWVKVIQHSPKQLSITEYSKLIQHKANHPIEYFTYLNNIVVC